jgi:hypothetical protein
MSRKPWIFERTGGASGRAVVSRAKPSFAFAALQLELLMVEIYAEII